MYIIIYIYNIIVKKLNFGFSIVFLVIKKKNMHLMKNVTIQICRSLCKK